MAGTEDEVVKDVDVVRIDGGKTVDDENEGDDSEDTDSDSTTEENEGDGEDSSDEEDPSKKPDEIIQNKKPTEDDGKKPADEDDGLEDVPGETPKERALRGVVKNLRTKLRKERGEDLLGKQPPKLAPGTRKELDDAEKAVLSKYKPEEIAALEEVLPVIAKKQGYVKQDELVQETYADKAQGYLDTFLEKHPEYLPESDTDGTLWEKFKSEFNLYKPPTDPKDFPRIFNKIHKEVFGLKPASSALKVNAQQEKKQVASHAGASKPNTPRQRTTADTSGYRTDMLKGFSEEETAEMFGE